MRGKIGRDTVRRVLTKPLLNYSSFIKNGAKGLPLHRFLLVDKIELADKGYFSCLALSGVYNAENHCRYGSCP